jgi:hypothetical protein
MATAHDLLLDADAFKAAYPSWPHPEPEQKTWEPVPPDEDWLGSRADYSDDEPGED